MDAISYSHSAKQARRIKRIIENPDSTSGIVTVPKVVASGENITIPAGRVAVLPNVQVNGTLNVEGDVFIPAGATLDGVVEKVVSTDNAIVRFNGTTGDVQNSNIIVDDNGNVGVNTPISNWASSLKNVEINNVSISSGVAHSSAANAIYGNNFYTDTSSLDIYKTTSIANKYQQGINGHSFFSAPSGTAGNTITWTQQMVLDQNANLTVGNASMSGTRAIIANSGTLANDQFVYINAGGGTAGVVNRLALIGVRKHSGITNACGYLNLYAQDGVANIMWTDDLDQLRISQTINHIGTTSGTVVGTQTSDERVKNIVGACPYGLQEILELETYKYSMKDDVEGSYKLGFIAQQAMGVIPESVYDTNERLTEAVTVIKQKVVKEAVKDEEGNILEPEVLEDYEDIEYQETADTITKLAMDYQMMIPVLVNAVKEQQELINSLTARLNRLEGNL